MKCDDCHKNTASVHFTQIVNNKKSDMSLCPDCAEKRGFAGHSKGDSVMGVGNLVSKIAAEYEEEQGASSCPRCKLRYLEFKKLGRLGCGHCYTAFGTRLDDLLRKIQGSDTHIGKMPKSVEPMVAKHRQLDGFKKELKEAIQAEDFEKAAAIRDTIRKMEHRKKDE